MVKGNRVEILNRRPSTNWLVVTGWGLSVTDLMNLPLNTIKQLGFSKKAEHPSNYGFLYLLGLFFFLIKYVEQHLRRSSNMID